MSTSSTDPGDIATTAPGRSLAAPDGHTPADTPADAPDTASAFDHPPARPQAPVYRPGPPPRPGDVTADWRGLLGAAWGLAFFAYAAIWNASVQIGIGTWWLGPRAASTPVVVKVLPFALCVACMLYVVANGPRVIRVSAVAAALAAVGALPDLSRSLGLGLAELAIATLLAVVTATSLTGRYRTASASSSPTPLAPPPPPAP